VLEGVSFMYSDATGDVPPGSIGGLVHADTRLLSTWVLTLNGARLLPLGSGSVEHYSAAFFLTNPELPGLPANEFSVRRLRSVGSQLRERIEVWCFAREPEHIEIRLSVANDFADLFEIKDVVRDRLSEISRSHAADGSALTFSYARDGFSVQTTVQVSPPATRVEGDDLVWELELADEATWTLDVTVPFTNQPRWIMPTHQGFGEVAGGPADDDATARWFAEVPRLESDSDLLCHIGDQTARDLLALRVEARVDGHAVVLPAAGLPWFLTVFGRDTLITAYQSVSFGPLLARGALLELASLQGRECNDFRDEEPGKIMHEIRQGELTLLGLKPHSPYYGTADATMLWLILLSEYWRWTGDSALVRRLERNVRAALEWIDTYGDRDGDGYVEYQTRSLQGLGNQCWRDSWDGVQFSDGRMPYLPLATCELQGYVYDARLRVAELADGPLADADLAGRLRTQAKDLKVQFNRDYWIDARGGYYAVALDGDKRQVDSLTSNIGHLLWSGIVDDDRAPAIVNQLMSDAMFSGWGVRTMATTDRGYNPIGYHLGTVWPHDNSLIVMGLARYGYREEANRIAIAQVEAASYTNYRLPEAFSGYARSVSRFPVPYPTACSPQAWASAAPLVYLRAMLGLDARDRELTLDPRIPVGFGRIAVRGIAAFGSRWDIEASGHAGTVHRAGAAPGSQGR
jgi:glycogen debranching enzyme